MDLFSFPKKGKAMATLHRSNDLGLLLFDASSSSIQWYSRCGHRLMGKYKCNTIPIDMTIVAFSTSGKYNSNNNSDRNQQNKDDKIISIVVLQKPKVLRIYSCRGDSYEVNLSFEVIRLISFPSGLILESIPRIPEEYRGENSSYSVTLLSLDFYTTNLFHITHPLASPIPINRGIYIQSLLTSAATMSPFEQFRRQSFESVMSGVDMSSPRSPDILINAKDMVILCTYGNLLLVYYRSSGQIALLLTTSKHALTTYLEENFPVVNNTVPGSNERSGRLSTTPFSPGKQLLSPDSNASMKMDSARMYSPFQNFRASSPSIPGLEHLAHLQTMNGVRSAYPTSTQYQSGYPLSRSTLAGNTKMNYFSKKVASTGSNSTHKHTNEHQKKPHRHSVGMPSTARSSAPSHSESTPGSDLAAVLLGERRRTVEPDIEREAYRDRERVGKRKLSIRSQLSTSPTYEQAPPAYTLGINHCNASGSNLSGSNMHPHAPYVGFTSIAASVSSQPSSGPSSQLPSQLSTIASSTEASTLRRGSIGPEVTPVITENKVTGLFVDTAAATAVYANKLRNRELPPLAAGVSPTNRHTTDAQPINDKYNLNVSFSRIDEQNLLSDSLILLPLASILPTDDTVFSFTTTASSTPPSRIDVIKQLQVELVGDFESPFGLYIHILNPINQAQLHYRVTAEAKHPSTGRVAPPVWSSSELDQIKYVQYYQLALTPVDITPSLPSSGLTSLCSDFQFQHFDILPSNAITTATINPSDRVPRYAITTATINPSDRVPRYAISTATINPSDRVPRYAISTLSTCKISLDIDLTVSGRMSHNTTGRSSFQLPLLISVQATEAGRYYGSILLGQSIITTVPLVWGSQVDTDLSWDDFSLLLKGETVNLSSEMCTEPLLATTSIKAASSVSTLSVATLGSGSTTHFLLIQRDNSACDGTRYAVLRLPVDLFQTPLLNDCVKAVMEVIQTESVSIQVAVISFLFIFAAQKLDQPILHLLLAIFNLKAISDVKSSEKVIKLRSELFSVYTSECSNSNLPLSIFDALHSVLEDRRLVATYSAADDDATVGLLKGLYSVAIFYSSISEAGVQYANNYIQLSPTLIANSNAKCALMSEMTPISSFTSNMQATTTSSGKIWLAECLSIVTEVIDEFKAGTDSLSVNPQRIVLPSFLPVQSVNSYAKRGWSMHQSFASIHLLHRLFQNIMMGFRMYAKSINTINHSTLQPHSREIDKISWRMIIAKAFVSAIKSSETGHTLEDGSTLDIPIMLQKLPTVIRAAVTISLLLSKEQPSSRWPTEILSFIGRQDIALRVNRRLLAQFLEPNENRPQHRLLSQQDGAITHHESQVQVKNTPQSSVHTKIVPVENLDGLREIESISYDWFPQDERVHEVCRMLKSSKHIYLRVDRAPEWTDEDYREKRQSKLMLLSRRALALGVGRGMATIQTLVPLMAEPLPLPQLVISARCPPNNNVLALDPGAITTDYMAWPEFHNGAAAGLRIGFASPSPLELFTDKRATIRSSLISDTDNINGRIANKNTNIHRQRVSGTVVTRNFIAYNKSNAFATGRHAAFAGCLLSLGIQGHLKVLSKNDIVEYLSSRDDQLSIATLIGVGASRLGSADPQTSKALCMQVPALLPPSWSFEVEISSVVQCAAFTGLGLLYCGTGHRLMAELLLDELTRKPNSYSCANREAIALSVSWALGMVLLGKGESMMATETDIEIPTVNVTNNSTVHNPTTFTTNSSRIPDSESKPAASSTPFTIPSDTGQPSQNSELESDTLLGLADLYIEDRLQLLIHGGKRPDSQQSLFSQPQPANDHAARSSRVLERDFINTDVTSVGSTIALALIYMRTNNIEIAKRIALPTTVLLLDAIRPDFMLYRALASCLILWDSVLPSPTWLSDRTPQEIKKVLFDPVKTGSTTSTSANLATNIQAPVADKKLEPKLSKFELKLASAVASTATVNTKNSSYSVLGQRELTPFIALTLYLNTVAGLCLGVGMVHAGTGDLNAKNLLLKQLLVLQGLRDGKSAGDIFKIKFSVTKVLRPTLECCIGTVSLALSCVMAGSGDLECLRVFRELRWRTEDSLGSGVSYGTHLSVNMAVGMLFLSGGRASLRRHDPVSTACLLISVLPRYPMKTLDNQFHLQALRHLYAVAVESRALQTVDTDTGDSVSLLLEIHLKDDSKLYKSTPCLLPELSTVKSVHMKTDLIESLVSASEKHIRMKKSTRQQIQEVLKGKDSYRNKDYLPASLDLEHENFDSKLFVKRRDYREGYDDCVGSGDKLTGQKSTEGHTESFKHVSQIIKQLAGASIAEKSDEMIESIPSYLHQLQKDVDNSDKNTQVQAELSELLGALTRPSVDTLVTVTDKDGVLLSETMRNFQPFVLLCDEASWKL